MAWPHLLLASKFQVVIITSTFIHTYMPSYLGVCRDGSAVELIGLSASTLLWLDKMHRAGLYPHSGVTGLYNGESAHTGLCACINLGI